MTREASVERNTKETGIKLKLVLDGTGYSDIETGVGFFDHMLDGFTRHGLFDLSVRVHGDLNVDDHHTIEDTAMRSKKQSETKKASAATEAAFFRWMKYLSSVQSICPAVRISPGMRNLPQKRSEIWRQKW